MGWSEKKSKSRWVEEYGHLWALAEGEGHRLWEGGSLLRKEPFSMHFHVITFPLWIFLESGSMNWMVSICPSRSSLQPSLLCSMPQEAALLSLYVRAPLTQASTCSQPVGWGWKCTNRRLEGRKGGQGTVLCLKLQLLSGGLSPKATALTRTGHS